MIADLRPYPAYMQFGADWIGALPERWKVRRLGWCVGINMRTLPEETSPDFEFAYLDISSVGTGHLVADPVRMTFASAPARARRIVSQGDTLVSTVRTYLKATWCADFQEGPLVCSTGFAVLSPGKQSSRFWGYVAQSEPFTRAVVSESIGVAYPAINDERFRHLLTALPPSEDQAAIVRFLDNVESRIRRLTLGKEKLIQLLEEERRATIHNAITRGSGLDVVPELWGRSRLKDIAWMKAGKAITSDSINERDEFPVFGGNGLRGYTTDFTHEGARILVGRQGALCGNVHLVNGRFWATEHAIVVEVRDQCDIRWLRLLLVAMDLNQYSQAAAQPGLSTDRIRNLEVRVPSLAEQRRIAESVDRITAGGEEVKKKASRQISLLREFRTRLISDVVTGKLDVREAAASLPDDPDVDDPVLDEQLEEVAAG